jgi:hypothetical protein
LTLNRAVRCQVVTRTVSGSRSSLRGDASHKERGSIWKNLHERLPAHTG